MSADGYVTTAEHQRMLRCMAFLRKELQSQTDRRHEYDGMEWAEAELAHVTTQANRWSVWNEAPNLVTIADVRRVDQQAVGHVDWAQKLCLYVAELVCYPRPWAVR